MKKSAKERIEVSIFRTDKIKTMISSIMNPRVKSGMASTMFDIARDVTAMVPTLSYTGPMWKFVVERSRGEHWEFVDNDEEVNFRTCTYLFGGSAYQLHAQNDNSRFEHILPGVHDIDLLSEIYFDAERYEGRTLRSQEMPLIFNQFLVDDMKSKKPGDVLNQPGILQYILREIVSTVRKRLKLSSPVKFYYRKTDSETRPDEIKILPAVLEHDSDMVVYQEIVDDVFLITVVDEETHVKVQVIVRGQMGDFVGHDHVFETLFDKQGYDLTCQDLVKVNGIYLQTKKQLFKMNMKSAVNRAGMAKHLADLPGEEEESIHAFGKCALDVLRLTYLILTDLDSEFPWVTAPTYMPDLYNDFFKVQDIHLTTKTPINYFIVYMEHLAPCVDRSGIGNFHLYNDATVNGGVNNRASNLMGEILKLFTEFSSERLKEETKKLALISDATSRSKHLLFHNRHYMRTNDLKSALRHRQRGKRYGGNFDVELDALVSTSESGTRTARVLIQSRGDHMYATVDGDEHYIVQSFYRKGGRYFECLLGHGGRLQLEAEEFADKAIHSMKHNHSLPVPEYILYNLWRFLLF